MSTIQTIGIIGYDKCSEQDTITTLEILRGTSRVLAGKVTPWKLKTPLANLDVKFLSLDPGNVTMQLGAVVVPDGVVKDSDMFDLLYIPGGTGSGLVRQDQRMLGIIQRHYSAGKIVASNCSGVSILARSGILGNNPVTCYAGVAQGLREEGINVPQPRRMWLGLPEARLWTTIGAFGVNGSTVALVAYYFGEEVGTIVSLMFDTLAGLGQQIFDLEGPECFFYPDYEALINTYFKPMLLPEPASQK